MTWNRIDLPDDPASDRAHETWLWRKLDEKAGRPARNAASDFGPLPTSD